MALLTGDLQKYIEDNYVPYHAEFEICAARLSHNGRQAIFDELEKRIEAKPEDKKIETSSWIPGSDWTGTVFYPIYVASNYDPEIAAKFFGQLVWCYFRDREDVWAFGRYKKDEVPIRGLTYFRIENPPPRR